MTTATWYGGLFLVAPLIFAAIVLILTTLSRDSSEIPWLPVLLSWSIVLLTMAYLLFAPSTNKLLQRRAEADHHARLQRKVIVEIRQQVASIDTRIMSLLRERRSIEETIEYRRSIIEDRARDILACPWQNAQGLEFEEFLERIFVNLGAGVSRTGKPGDQGVDLIVTIANRRIAVQAKGGISSIGNGAVQEAVAGQLFHGCNTCAVVTNSHFTSSAEELANKTNCCLVDGSSIEALALGRHPWFEPQIDFAPTS